MKPAVLKTGLILCGVFWSFSGVLIKELSTLGVTDPFFVSAVRSTIGLVFLLPLIREMFRPQRLAALVGITADEELRRAGIPGSHWRSVLYLGAAAYTCNILLLTWVFQHTNAASAVFLHYGGLLLICCISKSVLNQTPTKFDYLALLLFFIGMGVLVNTGFAMHEAAPTLAGVGCGITFAAFQTSLAKLSQWDEKLKLKVSLGLQCQFISDLATACIGGFFAFSQHAAIPHSMQAWLTLAAIGVIAWGLPNILFIILIRINPLLDSLVLGLGDPIFTAIWPMLFGFDAVRASPIIGSAIIFSALLIEGVSSETYAASLVRSL